MLKLFHLVRPWMRRRGFDLIRHNHLSAAGPRVAALLAANQVDLVLDVGANRGQYAQELRESGYDGHIVSYEPQSIAHAACVAAAQRDPAWDVAPRAAIGEAEGQTVIHLSRNSVSSSLRTMKQAHARAAPDSEFVSSEPVSVHRLGDVAKTVVQQYRRVYLKVDTQGSEAEVLSGAEGILDRVVGVQLEMSLVPLYDGAASFDQLREFLAGLGFTPAAFLPGFSDPKTGRMLQVDGIFFRPASDENLGV